MSSHEDVISISQDGDAVRVAFLKGDISQATMAQVEDQLLRLIEGGDKPNIRLDFDRVKYMATMGLGVLIGLHLKVKKFGGRLRFAGLNENLRMLIKMTRLDQVLDIEGG